MLPCADNESEWIKNGRSKPAPRDNQSWPGCLLPVLLPPRFEAYAKIRHPITANYQHIDHPHPFTEKEIAILKIPPCPEMRSYDFEFSFVGSPQELVSAILDNDTLEAFQIAHDTRIDYLVPVPNSPPKVSRS